MPTPERSFSQDVQDWEARFRHKHRDDPAVNRAIESLLAAECDAERLFYLLAMVGGGGNSITKNKLREMVRDLNLAAAQLRTFGSSRIVSRLDPDGQWASAYHSVLRVVSVIEGAIPAFVSHRDDWTSDAVTALSQDVRDCTLRPHDEEVGILATAAQGLRTERPIAARQRRVRTKIRTLGQP